ncbi:MAG: tetratricopeptide repeat protein [Kiritimatiellota bacterium]|nr:tetratricopeptide repeat protein [Kiritimatiellota bacterium]
MKTALLGFGLSTGIALAMLALAAVPIGIAADPSLPTSRPDSRRSGGTEESGSNSSAKPENRDEKSSPTSQFLTAYNSMSLADWLNEKGMRAEATDCYTEALNLFLKVSADYPQWQPAVVSFRINYCRGALQRLQGPGAEDAGRRTPEDGKSEIENLKSEISTLSPLNFKLQQAALKERGRDYTGALAMYIALLEEFPKEPWALKGACRCCLRLGLMDMARALIRQALTLPLPDADLNLLAALVDCHDGRYQAAISLLHQSLKQNSACPEAHAALGVALAAIGKMKEAREEMKRALSLNPKLGDAYYNLARLSLRQKPTDHDTARVHYQNALRHGAAPDPKLDKLLAE